jgi:hypothetical protein
VVVQVSIRWSVFNVAYNGHYVSAWNDPRCVYKPGKENRYDTFYKIGKIDTESEGGIGKESEVTLVEKIKMINHP